MKKSAIYTFLRKIPLESWLSYARWDDQKMQLIIMIPKEIYYSIIHSLPRFLRNEFPNLHFVTIKIKPTGKYAGGKIWFREYIPIVPDIDYRHLYLKVFYPDKFGLPEKVPEESINAWKEFFQLIPEDVRWKACVLASRQWRLWQLIIKFPKEGSQLLENNPVLAYMVANFHFFTGRKTTNYWRTVRRMIKHKQTQILRKLGFPSSRSLIRILKKLDYFDFYADHDIFEQIKEYFANHHTRKILTHLETIIPPHIELLQYEAEYPGLLHINFYRNVSMLGSENLLYLVREIARMMEIIEARPGKRKIDSAESLQRYHEKLIFRLNTSMKDKKYNAKKIHFPIPPLQGKVIDERIWIEPITNPGQLFAEGREMNHCVYSHLNSIAFKKNIYIYKIIKPERGTVAIHRNQASMKWELKEIRGKGNSAVSPATLQVILKWIEEENEKICNL